MAPGLGGRLRRGVPPGRGRSPVLELLGAAARGGGLGVHRSSTCLAGLRRSSSVALGAGRGRAGAGGRWSGRSTWPGPTRPATRSAAASGLPIWWPPPGSRPASTTWHYVGEPYRPDAWVVYTTRLPPAPDLARRSSQSAGPRPAPTTWCWCSAPAPPTSPSYHFCLDATVPGGPVGGRGRRPALPVRPRLEPAAALAEQVAGASR